MTNEGKLLPERIEKEIKVIEEIFNNEGVRWDLRFLRTLIQRELSRPSAEPVEWPPEKAFDNLYDIDKGKGYSLSARLKHYEHKGYNEGRQDAITAFNRARGV